MVPEPAQAVLSGQASLPVETSRAKVIRTSCGTLFDALVTVFDQLGFGVVGDDCLLAATGRLGYFTQHRLTNHLAGSAVRRSLGQRLERLVHFGELQVFPPPKRLRRHLGCQAHYERASRAGDGVRPGGVDRRRASAAAGRGRHSAEQSSPQAISAHHRLVGTLRASSFR